MESRSFFIVLTIVAVAVGCKRQELVSPKEKKWVVTTVAGDGSAIFRDGPALSASFRAPLDVVVNPDGTIYVADAVNHRIRKIAGGQVTTFAGTGFGDTTSGGSNRASFLLPSQLAIDGTGNLYTLDIDDPRIRKITPTALVSGYAGSGIEGFLDGRADTAQFGEEASGIAYDGHGNFYVSDFDNRRVRKINSAGEVSTVAGNGGQGFINGEAATAEFFSLGGIVIDKQGNLFVADWNQIRKITPSGIVSTFAGSDSSGFRDGQAGVARFTFLGDLAIDEQGNIYAIDDNRIRKITPQGLVSTVAGSSGGYADGDGTSAKFSNPAGLGIDGQGNLYVADANNNRIRKISLQ